MLHTRIVRFNVMAIAALFELNTVLLHKGNILLLRMQELGVTAGWSPGFQPFCMFWATVTEGLSGPSVTAPRKTPSPSRSSLAPPPTRALAARAGKAPPPPSAVAQRPPATSLRGSQRPYRRGGEFFFLLHRRDSAWIRRPLGSGEAATASGDC